MHSEVGAGAVREIVLTPADLAHTRFAHSPVRELAASLRILYDPGRQRMYGSWLSTARGRLGGLRLDLLAALAPAWGLPDFVAPPPAAQWGVLADELDAVAATTPAEVRAGLDSLYRDRPLPAVLGPLYEDPAAQLPMVVDEMRRYWQAAVEPVWPRLRGLIVADLAYRMERFVVGGIGRVFQDLHPQLDLVDDRLRIGGPWARHHRVEAAGLGILLVPCALSWPALIVGRGAGQPMPTLSYPTRGVAALCEEPQAEHGDPLCALVGRTRAALLAALVLPATTAQLAELLDLSLPAVSQHLKILKGTALVTARRRGRVVLYQRTARATALLDTCPVGQGHRLTAGRGRGRHGATVEARAAAPAVRRP